jgi:hypothetical protein
MQRLVLLDVPLAENEAAAPAGSGLTVNFHIAIKDL